MRWNLLAVLALPLGACGEPDFDPAASAHGTEEVAIQVQPRTGSIEVELVALPARPPVQRVPAAIDPTTPTYVYGRLVDPRGGPLPEKGIRVRLNMGASKQELRTDPDGRFRFELVEPFRYASISVHPRWPWRLRVPKPNQSKRLTPEQLEGEEEIVYEVAERRRGTVGGVAVDSDNGTPIPHLRFTIKATGARDSHRWFEPIAVETDEDGRFHTGTEILGGPVKVRHGRGEAYPVDFRPDCLIPGGLGAEPWVLAFRTGRTLELRLTGEVPGDPTTLRAWLLTPGKARAVVETNLRVHADGGVWIRPPKPKVQAGGSGLLAVGDEDGLVLGVQELRWGAEPEVLHVHLERTAAVELDLDYERPEKYSDYAGSPYLRRSVKLEPSDLALVDGSFPWRNARKGGLTPGSYVLRASTREHAEVVQTIELEAGRVHAVSLYLQLARGSRTVHGRARTESGAPLPNFGVSAHLRDAPNKVWSASYSAVPRWCGTGIDHSVGLEEGSEPEVGRFRFERVPAGPLVVLATSWRRACTATVTERADGDVDLEVVVLDRDGGPGIGFRVKLAEGEFAPRVLRVHTRAHDGGPNLPGNAYNGRVIARADTLEREFEWAVTVRGRRPVYGTQHDFLPAAGGCAFAPLRFERGWGTRVLVCDLEGAPLAGLAIIVDGEPAGFTDADGMLELAREEAPVRIEVDTPGLRPIPAYPALSSSPPWYEIRMGASAGR